MEIPKLIEPMAKNYLFDNLKQCHSTKTTLYINIWNLLIFVGFIIITASILYLCATRKETPKEKEEKLRKDQEYILNKIRSLREIDNYRNQMNSMTKMPYTTDIVKEHPSGYSY
jgi:hypothetical protein